MATILLIGTFDTKGNEFAYVRDLIAARGHTPITLDAGTQGEPPFPPSITAAQIAEAGDSSLAKLRTIGDRGTALDVMTRGAIKTALQLHAEGKCDGVIGLGGSGGTAVTTAVMRELPIGLPKVMVSTLASGDTRSYVGVKDITLMYSVVDIAGLNQLSRRILANAAGAVCGMVEQNMPPAVDKPLVAATMFGVTTPCVTAVREHLEASGYEVLVFHATGTGGQAMEALIEAGFLVGVADVTTTEWCDELLGGVLAAGPTRLDAAAKLGLPQVVSCGALDMVNFWAPETVPEKYSHRQFHRHNANITLMRTTPDECAQLGKIIADKLNAASGPVAFFIPLRGVSAIDKEGSAFYSPEADAALFGSLRQYLEPPVELIELDLHINDPRFAKAMADKLLTMLSTDSR
jgi:uncharacterized protein (UPF0261 family)